MPKENLKGYHSQATRGRKLNCDIQYELDTKIISYLIAPTLFQRKTQFINKTDESKTLTEDSRLHIFKQSYIELKVFSIF